MDIHALCIDQDNPTERDHQVRQMASVYKRDRQVVFWLGTATAEIDRAFCYMRHPEREALRYPCKDWQTFDERWHFLWSTVEIQVNRDSELNKAMQQFDCCAIFD